MENTDRFNTFYIIHKALRNMMFDTALTIQQTDFTNEKEAKAAAEKIRTTIDNFDDHANHEDTFLMPMIEKYDKETVDKFEKEHVEDHRLGKEMTEALEKLEKADNNNEKKAAGLSLLYGFNDFIAFNLYHMNREEDILNGILWKYYTDQEIMEMQGRLVASIPPEKNMVSVMWMIKSISNDELSDFLGFQKHNLPPDIYGKLTGLAERLLPEERWKAVCLKIKD